MTDSVDVYTVETVNENKLKKTIKDKMKYLWYKTINYIYCTLAVLILMVVPITANYLIGSYKQGIETTYLKCHAKVGDKTIDGLMRQRNHYYSLLGFKLINTHAMDKEIFMELNGSPITIIGHTGNEYDSYRNKGGEFYKVKFRNHDTFIFQINEQVTVTNNFCR